MKHLKEERTSHRQLNTRLINEPKSILDSAEIVAIASMTQRLGAHNADLDKLNDMIENYTTGEEFAAEFETVVQD
ncbi:hypothetical protein HPB50_027684 [Hyalomma asiaticum]|nr:hypothetical protein HPB50_027684 [Hyalomma asiaticum]